MHLVGFITEIYYDARSYKRQICKYIFHSFNPILILKRIPIVCSFRQLCRFFFLQYSIVLQLLMDTLQTLVNIRKTDEDN